MIDELHVSNIALIEDATLEFPPGLTVLTGETGAGKTALLAALKLICGNRADNSFVRDGASEALAEARLMDDGEHIVRRRLTASGRSRCSIDGAMATVTELAQAAHFIELHGQHEQVLLLEPARQLAYLDSWARDDDALETYRQARSEYHTAREKLDQIEQDRGKNEQELEFMRYTCEQIESVAPQRGEIEELEEELPRLQHADQLAHAIQQACAALNDDAGVLDILSQGTQELKQQQGIDDELDGFIDRLDGQTRELEDITRDLNAYAQGINTDPYRLEEVLSRLDKLNGLMKRFGPDMDHVFDTWDRAKEAVESAQDSPQRLEEVRKRVDCAREALEEAAAQLSQMRHSAADDFCARLAESTAELAMEGARFEFSFEELPFERWGESGAEHVELLYQPAPSAQARPLRRIASGGELSRILLAMECLHYDSHSNRQTRPTIVFDEVDSGIGGATGNAIARRLSALSSEAQVIVVTHLAQVAAFADEHYVVSKRNVEGSLPETTVYPVYGEDRVVEIARMLSGDNDERALEHARALLEGVRQ